MLTYVGNIYITSKRHITDNFLSHYCSTSSIKAAMNIYYADITFMKPAIDDNTCSVAPAIIIPRHLVHDQREKSQMLSK